MAHESDGNGQYSHKATKPVLFQPCDILILIFIGFALLAIWIFFTDTIPEEYLVNLRLRFGNGVVQRGEHSIIGGALSPKRQQGLGLSQHTWVFALFAC